MTAIDTRAKELGTKLGNPLSAEIEVVGGVKLKGFDNGVLFDIPGAGVYAFAEATVAARFTADSLQPVSPLDVAISQVPSPNHWAGREGQKPIAIVIHTMAGFMAGCDATFKNPATEVSAHYGIGVDGKVHQYVALEDSSWANGRLEDGNRWIGPVTVSPNRLTVTIETEDLNNADQPVTEDQFRATLAVCQLALKQFPSITHLMTHTVISPNSRANCPGKRWLASGRFQQLATALNLKPLV